MNWRKTEEFYNAEGLPYISEEAQRNDPRIRKPAFSYQKKADQLDLERWELKVKDRNGYRQRAGDNTKYPTTRVIQAKRIRTLDGNEWLNTFVELMGIDAIGNRVPITATNQEVYIKPEFFKELRGNSREGDPVIVSVREDERVYTLPFTPENVDKIMEGQNPRRVAFSISEDLGTGPQVPREVRTLEDFRNKSFEELYTPIPETRHAETTAGPRRQQQQQK